MLACLLLVLAIISDLADGPVARSAGQDSPAGGLLDHGCDALYVVTGLLALGSVSLVPILLPVLVALAFIQYVLDSSALQGHYLRTNKLGRYNGIAYFVLLAVALFASLMVRAETLQPVTNALGWMLIVSTTLSMSDRMWTLLNGKLRQ